MSEFLFSVWLGYGPYQYAVCNPWHHFASLSVVGGSDQIWLRLPLSVDTIVWPTVLLHNPCFRDQWQFLRGIAKHSSFLSTVASFPFFCLPAYQQWFMSAGILSPSGRWEKAAVKLQGEEELTLTDHRTAVLAVPFPFPFPRRDAASSSLFHALQIAYPSFSAWGQFFTSSVPSGRLHSKEHSWLQGFAYIIATVAAH